MSSTTTAEEGRHVHYVPSTDGDGGTGAFLADRPHAAVIAHVHGPSMVNLSVLDRNGVWVPKTSVRLIQPGEMPPGSQSYARWMPYHLEKVAADKFVG